MRVTCLIALFVLAVGNTATAAPLTRFQRTYGSPVVDEVATNIIPVSTCAGGGFLAVAYVEQDVRPFMAYLIRTRANGTPLWENVYRFEGAEVNASAAIESGDGSGFIVGGMRAPIGVPDSDVWIMKIDCDGKPLWARSYDAGGRENARQLVEATTGDPSRGTHRGDIIVVGDSSLRGMLMRIHADGTALWQRVYDNGHDPWDVGELLSEVIQAEPAPGALTGDIVAAGTLTNFVSDERRGYALRVDGNTGSIDPGAPDHGAAYYGSATQIADFGAVVELASRELVFLGRTSPSYFNVATLFAVRTKAAPWSAIDQRGISKPGRHAIAAAAVSKHLIHSNRIVLVGKLTQNTVEHAFALSLDATLVPIEGTGRLYGDQTVASGISLLETGLAISGIRRASFGRDVFLVRADSDGRTGCELEWKPSPSLPAVEVTRLSAIALHGALTTRKQTADVKRVATPTSACPVP